MLAFFFALAFQGFIGGAASLSVHSGSTEMTDIGTTYTQVTAYDTANVYAGNYLLTRILEADADTDIITIKQAGDYKIQHQMSFTGSLNSYFECAAFINTNTELERIEFRSGVDPTGDPMSGSAVGIALLDVDDTIMVKCHGQNAGDDLTPISAQLVVTKIR